MDIEEKRKRQREANRRWRERNPDKVREANRRPRHRLYDSEYRRVYYERTKAKRRPHDRENERRRATELRAWLSEYKATVGCVDCGFSDSRALDFDHVRGDKHLNISFAKSRAQAEQEIEKCEVRCSNCHRIRSHQRLRARK